MQFTNLQFVWEQGFDFPVERNAFAIDHQDVCHDVVTCKPADMVAFIRGSPLIRNVLAGVGNFFG